MAKKKNTLKPVGTYAQNMNNRLQTLRTGNGTVGSYQERINSLNNFMAKARDEERKRQAEAEQQQRALEKSRQETANMKKLTQDLTYGYNGRYDPSLAYQAKMMGLKAKDVQEEVNKSEQLYKAIDRAEKEYNAQTDLGYAGVQKDRKIYGTDNTLTMDQWFRVKGKERENQAKGYNDNGDDPFIMTEEGRAAYRKKAEANANNLKNRAQRYADYNEDDALAGLFDRMYERDIANEQAIIDNPYWKGKEEESTALARKATLESERNEARRQATENAHRMRDSGINLQADEAHMPQLRKEVYDWIMTDGYENRTKQNKAEIDAIIDEYITGLRYPWSNGTTQADAINAANSMAAAYESKVQKADEAQKYYDWKNKWTALAADDTYYNASNEYIPENAPQVRMVFDNTAQDYVPEVEGDEVAKAYWYANNYQSMNGLQNSLDYANKYMFIASDPDILRTFNEMYNKDMENGYRGERGSNLAEQFLKGLDPYLSTMLVDYQKDFIRSKAEDPVAGTAGRIMSPLLQAVGGIVGTVGTVFGAEKDSKAYLTSRVVSELRSQQNENVGEWADRVFGDGSGDIAKFMLGVVDSIADNVFAMGTGTALAGKGTDGAMRLVQLIMSGSATSNKMIENLDKGMDGTEAALSAVGSGIIEWLTERYSLERIMGPDIRQLYGNKRAMASFLARSAGAEGSEEIASGILETGLDSILSMVYGHADEITQRYNELITSDPRMTHQEATRIAMEEKLAEIGMEGLAGAMSGLGMAGSRVITTALENRAEGRNIQEKENGSSRVIDLAKQMGEGTESRALAEQLEKAAAEGKTIKNGDLGRLANLTALDVGEERSNAIKETINRKVTQQLTDKGISESDAAVYAQIIGKSIFDGGRLTAHERKTLAQNEEAIKLFASYNTFSKETLDLRKEINKETAPLDSIADQIGELAGKPEAEQESAAAAAVQESMKAADSMEEAIDNLQAKNSGLLSEGFAKLVKDELASNPVLKKSKTYLDDMMKIRLAAMTGDSMPRTALDKDVAQRFFDAAKAEFDEVDADRVVPQAPALEGQGKATFNGAEYGTDAWKQETQGLSKWTRNVMGAVGEIAARFGYRVNLVNDPENKDVYGFEDANTGAITINVANGFKHHMLVTMAHEMTHWLEQNSRGGYNDLRSFVLESLRKEGVNVQERIVKIMDNYNMVMKPEAGKGMTINQAMAELVAQSSEGLLSSRRAAMELQSINPTLYGRVQNYVKNIVARLDAAIHSMEYEASMSQEAKALRNYREQLADIWFNGRKDAQGQQGPIVKENVQQAEEQTEVRNEAEKPQNVQYSVAQREADPELDRLYEEMTAARTEEQEARARLKEIDSESKAWVDRVTAAMGTGNEESVMAEYKKWEEEVFTPLSNRLSEANRRVKEANRAFDEYTENRDMAAEQQAIEKSGLSEPDYRRNQAVNEFGYTTDFREAGYMLPNGRMLNFTGEKGRHMGRRGQDHRAISTVYASRELQGGQAMIKFMADGNIRIMAETPGIDIIKEPTAEQYAQIRAMARRFAGEEYFNIDFTDEKGFVIDSIEYDGRVNADKIVNDIKHYFRTGEVPQQSTVSQFHYSIAQRDAAYQAAVDSGNVEEQQKLVDQAAEKAMPDSKVRDKNGKLLKMYHGTKADFNVFDTSVSGGVNGTAEGFGIYMADSQEVTEKYGDKQIASYVDMKRPAHDDRTTIKKNELIKLIRKTCVNQAENMLDEGYADNMKDALQDTWISNYVYTPGFRSIDEAYAEVASSILRMNDNDMGIVQEVMAGMAIRDYEDAMDFYHNMLTPTIGVDGYWTVWHNNETGKDYNVLLAFDSSQIKKADPITYDDQGNVIPLSERFNTNNEDIRYSIAQSPDMEVNNFMMGLNEFNLPTYQEKTMLRQYKDARTRAELLRYGIREREYERKKLLAMEKRGLKENKRLSQINDFLARDRARLNQLEKTLVDVTRDKGYARLMMNQKNLMDNLVSGRTAGELEETVNNIQKNLDDVTKEMAERAENLKKLANAEAVLKIRQMFDARGLKAIAAKLKNDLGSELENKEIENRLAMIALKMKEGKYDAETAEELADLLAGRMQGEYEGYFISELRGSTITLGPAQLKELKGSGRSLSDIRQQLAGTGIRIGTKGSTTLDAKWDELCDIFPTLDRNESAGNMLDVLLDKITSEKNEQPTVYNNEQLMDTNRMILEAAQKLIPEIITDENSLKLIRETMAFVAKVSGAAKSSAEAMDDINAMISKLQKKSSKAIVTARKLTGDIGETIEYFDQLSLQSEAAMWKQERIRLIDQLKSENTKALMEEADKWREKIEKDKAFRELAGENLHTRKKITTNVSRLRKLLINETDLKNIPEHMKGLAREMLGKIVENDLARRKLTGIDRKDLAETGRVLEEMKKLDGDFTPDDLRLIADEEAQAVVMDALADLEEGLEEYNSHRTGTMMDNANAVKATLDKISDAVSKITGIINAERSVSFLDRQVTVGEAADDVRKDFQNTRFRGELAGRGSKAVNTIKRTVVYGNMTPEYYIENLRNRGMTELWQDMKRGENRNGLEVRKAQDHMAQLAAETNYKAWANEKHDVTLGGMKRTLTIGNMMELYAIWQREHTSNPEMSQHLNKGGVFFQDDSQQTGKLRHEQNQQRAIRVTDEEIQAMYNSMTAEQKQLIDGVVKYLSNDMSDLGNEASMRMYGIKKYKETYYFPMKVWDGVKSARSDKGITGTDENRAAHKSWSKRRQHMARNALVIGDFMTDAINHIVEMINYNTMAPSIENINKVLNYKFTEEAGTDNETQRNLRVMFRENYGLESLKYLEDLLKDLNGGPAQDQRKTLRDRMLSVFKKNAVAGSMSVALQQPLSYIRAAMMINPKYLAEGLTKFWKGSYQEMIQHSGVAVIKDMGRFDMNFGQSAKDYIMPETKLNLYNKASDVLTKAPEMMDRMTWTRMWAAVKAEQAAKNPGMNTSSEEFMNKVTERFNELMRKTQVYDSILVKSSNMRSTNLGMKVITSFMAEPTLSLNVLADAIRNAGAEGGKKKLTKALATFLLSAIMQAGVKALMGSGRTPDKKKTWTENFLNKLQYNLMNEANPVNLVPGTSDIIEVLKTGELKDDAMGAIGKLFNIVDTTRKAMEGKGKGAYRDMEDTVGQFAQLFTNIPAKNLMRDARAIYNWIAGSEYASRPTSGNVLKYQSEANRFTGDDLLGVLNTWMGEAGFTTSNASYYSRIYQATKNGNTAEAGALKEYMKLAKGTSDDAMKNGLKAAAKKDTSMTEAERSSWMISNGLMDNTNTVTTQYKEGKITRAEAEKLYKEVDPEITDDDLWWKLDRMDYQKETGADSVSGYSYRLKDAIQNNKADEIRKVVEDLIKHGRTQKQIKDALSDWKSAYLEADARTKTAIRDAIQKAYKAMGLTAADADKVINGWKNNKKSQTGTDKDTTGRYGKGNIDLNNRKVVHNSDGTISTEKSFSTNIDGKEVLLPTIINGKEVSEEEAIQHYLRTGENLGIFNTVKEARDYALKLHKRQDWYYNNK